MLPNTLPQLIDTLLRLPRTDATQLRELMQHLPDPHAAALEMARRGWITQNQFSSLFPDSLQRPTPQETMLHGVGDGETVTDADDDYWGLPLSDEEDKVDVPPAVDWAKPDRPDQKFLPEPGTLKAVPVLTGAANSPPFQSAAPFLAGGYEARRRAKGTKRRRRPWRGKGPLIWILCLGSFFVGLQFFVAKSTVLAVPRQDPPKTVDVPLIPNPLNDAITKQYEEVIKRISQSTPPAASVGVRSATPVAVPPAVPVAAKAPVITAKAPVKAKAPARSYDARPKSTASLYDRVRQVVLENRTEETERLGIGDIAYRDVPDDGSIMVGMEVTYAPLFNHNLIKSVRPIYQRPNGTRYDGPVCGIPTGVGERVVAKVGYAIGAATIRSGMGIDAIQLTFMEIGAEGLNPSKSYLSKWLDSDGGSGAKTFVNDGRPIIGIAGMRSKESNNWTPAFCLSLVTTRAGALAAADGQAMMTTQPQMDSQVPLQRQK